ncbi:MAG: hypothetical protein SOV20_08955 [Coriobacteriales bacterium]|nr:hypothetical protein [Coriobacteriales bacterium]
MTPTSDERRKVAEELRGLRHMTYYSEEVVENIKDAIGIADPVNTFREPEDIYELLAGLIDPTCHIADDDWASRQCMGPMLSCDRCGNAFPEINGPYQYCPCCGARVVSD